MSTVFNPTATSAVMRRQLWSLLGNPLGYVFILAFVLLAGAAAVSPWRFGAAIVIGRGIRYFGQGYLAVLYGERAADFMRDYGPQIGIGLAVIATAAAIIVVRLRRAL